MVLHGNTAKWIALTGKMINAFIMIKYQVKGMILKILN